MKADTSVLWGKKLREQNGETFAVRFSYFLKEDESSVTKGKQQDIWMFEEMNFKKFWYNSNDTGYIRMTWNEHTLQFFLVSQWRKMYFICVTVKLW